MKDLLNKKANAVYIHLPFCRSICKFCSFSVLPHNVYNIAEYLELLATEINLLNKLNFDLTGCKSIYFGGGTPSVIAIKEIKNILKRFNVPKNITISFEINPEDASLEYLESLIDVGVNRFSLGIQSFNDTYLLSSSRKHLAKDNHAAIDNLKKLNIKNFNIDLMYGFLNQSLADVEKDVDVFLQAGATHISAYHLNIEPKTPFFHNKSWKHWYENNDNLFWEMFNIIYTKLETNNLACYEISNFALKNFESPQNIVYWQQENFVAVGLGSFWRLDDYRVNNFQKYHSYKQAIDSGNLPIENMEKINSFQMLDEYLIMNLRRPQGLKLELLASKFEFINWPKFVNKLSANQAFLKRATINNNSIKLNLSGLFIADHLTKNLSIELEKDEYRV